MSDLDEQVTPAVEALSVDDLAQRVTLALQEGDTQGACRIVEDLRTRDFADVIDLLSPEHRIALIQALGPAFDFEVLSEIEETVRDQLSEALPNELLAKAVAELETDDAAYLIENLEEADREEILAQLSRGERAILERQLEYPEESAGRLMQSNLVAVAPYWTVQQVIEHARETDDLPDTFSEIFVVDPAFRVLGSVDLSRLLRTKRDVAVSEIMDADLHVVLDTADQEDVARQFERYDLISAPVVDQNNKLVGVITVDDVVDVLEEEAEEDLKALGGVRAEEELSGGVLVTSRSRLPWLIVNMGTAFIAATVISFFEATIEAVVAVAFLMPVNAALGGNSGTQAMTVAVRALATRQINRSNRSRIITRECLVGLINGCVLACLAGTIAGIAFQNHTLAFVLGGAMVLTVVFATTLGILIPLLLDRIGTDPAIASGVFVTTTTDVFGFFIFLSLATVAFGLI